MKNPAPVRPSGVSQPADEISHRPPSNTDPDPTREDAICRMRRGREITAYLIRADCILRRIRKIYASHSANAESVCSQITLKLYRAGLSHFSALEQAAVLGNLSAWNTGSSDEPE